MRAVIIAGGSSSRFWPLNDVHKSLIEICGKPLIARTINMLPKVDEVVVVESSKQYIKKALKGVKLDKQVEYRVQDESNGMWDAILIGAEDYGDDVIVVSGHQISPFALGKLGIGRGTKLLVSQVSNPEGYGVVEVKGDKIIGVEEKPENPKSNLILNSAYRFSNEFIRMLKKDKGKDHFKLERVLNDYLSEHPSEFEMIPKEELPSLKYPWHALVVMERLLEEIEPKVNGFVDEGAELKGEVFIEEGAKVFAGAKIYGPAYIGRGAIIGTNALVRQSSIEAGAVVGFGSEVAKSLVGPETKMHHAFIGDSVIGKKVWMGFGFITANRRLDKKTVKTTIGISEKDTGRGHFGTIIGPNCKLGIRCSTMPGVLVGKDVIVGPHTILRKNVIDEKIIYVKQEQVIK